MDKCLITGGNSGIGEAVFNLLEDDRGSVNSLFRPSHAELNVTSQDHARRYIEMHGPFSHIVYSAGVNELCWAKDNRMPYVALDTFRVNAFGFISLVSEHLRTWPKASVSAVAVSSDAADVPMRGSTAYCVSKAALNMAVRTLARELAPMWRINAVAPGMVEGTAMTEYIDNTIPEFRGWTREFARRYERSSVPTGRRATLEEVAETIRWVLLGPEQMTGAIIRINGGRS